MEIILLWLDEFDDLVFSVTMAWERLRHRSLQIGFLAALALPVMVQSGLWMPLVPVVYAISAAGVCVWGGSLFGARLLDPRFEYSVSPASNA